MYSDSFDQKENMNTCVYSMCSNLVPRGSGNEELNCGNSLPADMRD